MTQETEKKSAKEFDKRMSRLVDGANDFFGDRPGFLPILGFLLVFLDLLLQIFLGPNSGWFVSSSFLMHLGVMIAILGILLARALEG